MKTCQVGGYLDRMLVTEGSRKKIIKLANSAGETEGIPYINAYFDEIEALTLTWAPLFLDDATNVALASDPDVVSRQELASLAIGHRSSMLHCHQDKASALPATISGGHPLDDMKDYKGGSLLLVDGNFSIGYGLGDVALLNGARMHAVLPIQPSDGVTNATRFSVVRFSRQALSGEWSEANYLTGSKRRKKSS